MQAVVRDQTTDDAVIAFALRHMQTGGGPALAATQLPDPPMRNYPMNGYGTNAMSHDDGLNQGSAVDALNGNQLACNLPWHFSWIDSDSMIGGSSAPTERRHWNALRDANVGLVVNLTESPVSPPRRHVHTLGDADLLFGAASVWDDIGAGGVAGTDTESSSSIEYSGSCAKCGHVDEVYDADLFKDVAVEASNASGGMSVLFLPIPDGSVPRFEQIDIFLKEATATIKAGKKVIVHCQAGVGRTGTFLAVYLINKYKFDPVTAISVLRRYRPQSLQFHSTDWQVDPFRLHPDPKAYNRNMVQERFVERWWHVMVRERRRTSVSRGIGCSSPLGDVASAHDEARVADFAQHKHKRRATIVMEGSKLIPDDAHDESGAAERKSGGKHRRRHTDSNGATYEGFVEYLIALSKQQQQQKQHLLHPQLQSLQTLPENPTDATMADGGTSASPLSTSGNNTSILSSSLSAISAYPTPPRTLETSSTIKHVNYAPAANSPPVQPVSPLAQSFATSQLQFSVTPAAEPSQPASQLSSSLTDSLSKLSTSLPPAHHPYSRSVAAAPGSYQRKRHPKPYLHNPGNLGGASSAPKSSSFTISSILLKLIDQQLDAKFSAFVNPCIVNTPHATRAAAELNLPFVDESIAGKLVQASGTSVPVDAETSATLCYGCRGVVSVGPEIVVHRPQPLSSQLNNAASSAVVWPVLVPFPKRGDEVGAPVFSAGGLNGSLSNASMMSPRSPVSPQASAVDSLLMMSGSNGSFASQGKSFGRGGAAAADGWGAAQFTRHRGSSASLGVFGEDMDLDLDGDGGPNVSTISAAGSFVVGSVTSDLNGAVEALKLEEVQRREISLAVRNRVV
ncbi:hypothetical protein CcCBS67573_g04286 [Chytriomyces confervae]|uniref:Tyrosine specific protein phosphatases domain-containing protein n=1 Tax=Chytriomyces confervae TaxID=246404 RepID=A0A507FDY8_9FUNG|nr:Dual specificity protein phosphatase 23 [Chytriomyces hyalinus]TPX74444.1 hypothetical protein CcCBS67573_g04286 [Chytriomyces confervae]